MRLKWCGALMLAAVGMAACGTEEPTVQDEIADVMIDYVQEEIEAGGFAPDAVDEGCIRDLVSDLSDTDAQVILDAGVFVHLDDRTDLTTEALEINTAIVDRCLNLP